MGESVKSVPGLFQEGSPLIHDGCSGWRLLCISDGNCRIAVPDAVTSANEDELELDLENQDGIEQTNPVQRHWLPNSFRSKL